MRKLLALTSILALPLIAGCAVHQDGAPSTLSGPAGAALSVKMFATPDSLPQDGVSQSVVAVQAFDAAGHPISGLTIRMSVAGLGTIAPGSIVTGTDGKASAVFTAPPSGAITNSVTVLGTPAGSDSATTSSSQVSIKLTQIGSPAPVATVPNTAPPTVEFQSSPGAPVVGQSVSFNASQTVAASGHYVTRYDWDFGDGSPHDTTTGQFPFHTFSVAGTYNVLLTVTDDVGAKATKVHAIVIGQGLPTVVLIVSKNGLTVTADAGGSFASPGSSITSYVFIWNDGNQDVTATSIATHTYAGPVAPATTESFTITVRAIDDRGRVGTATANVTLP